MYSSKLNLTNVYYFPCIAGHSKAVALFTGVTVWSPCHSIRLSTVFAEDMREAMVERCSVGAFGCLAIMLAGKTL